MLEDLNRRNFLKNSAIVSAGATLGLSLEEKILLGRKTAKASAAERQTSASDLPAGRIGKVKISRIICGGNLINGFAHARDLIYVSSLLRHYFTDEKIMDPTIRAQLNKVEVVADPEIEKVFPALQRVGVTIETTDGRQVGMELDYPKGDPRNPLTEPEIEGKFDALADGVLSKDKARRLKDAVWQVDGMDSVSELLELCVTDL